MIRLMPFSGRPPPRIPSSPSSPLVPRSSTRRLSCPRRATSALAPSRSLTVETSSSGSSGFCRKASAPAASASSRASRTEMASTAPASCCFRRRHSSAPRPPEIISSTIASWGRLSSHCSSASSTASARCTSYPSVRRKNCARSAATGSRSASSTSSRVRSPGPSLHRPADHPRLVGEQAVGVGRREPARHLRRDEAQLLHVIAGVQAVSARAPLRDDRRVALLPVADRRNRNAEHPSHRTDAVDAAAAASLHQTRRWMLTDRARMVRYGSRI